MKNALCLGSFDGLHRAHREVLNIGNDYYKIAVTFKVPPKIVMSDQKTLIMTFEDKCETLKELSVDKIVVLDFLDVKDIDYNEFLYNLKVKYSPKLISCGFNYRFGKNGEGDISKLKEFCISNGIELRVVDKISTDDKTISSTLIRTYLQNGEIEKANKLLYKPFSFTAEVIEGDKRGRTIGFPTVNQRYPAELLKLKFGVYKTKVEFDNKVYFGITNIGKRPTFETDYIISETYIKDFSGDLYGKNLKITPLEFLRDEKKFSNICQLKDQIKVDVEM